MIELTGWFDIFGIVLNLIWILYWVFVGVSAIIAVYYIAQGLLYFVNLELSIKEIENGEHE